MARPGYGGGPDMAAARIGRGPDLARPGENAARLPADMDIEKI
jgi:hypothetical protein